MQQARTLQHGSAVDAGMDPARIELIRERARSWVANGDTPSLVLLIARRGVIVLEEAYGILRPSDNAPLQTDSIFPLMSISKSLTAAAVMCLVEDGLLSLKHPVTDYVREIIAPGTDQVLIADLLTHTSGYDDVVVFNHAWARHKAQVESPGVEPAHGQHPQTERLIRYASDAPLGTAPGQVMNYSNFGYLVLGDIVRRVSGVSLAEFVEARIFGPLGMNDSRFVLPRSSRGRRVVRQTGYPGTDASWWSMAAVDSEEWDAWDNGFGGAKSTANNLARFGQMLLNGGGYDGRQVLSRAAVAAMTAPQLVPGTRLIYTATDPTTKALVEYPIRGGNYGYGLFVWGNERSLYINGSLMSTNTFGHSGAFGSAFWVDPDNDVVGIYLSVQPKYRRLIGDMFWKCDHFQDMVHAAIVD